MRGGSRLGESTEYRHAYSPELLNSIARDKDRTMLGIAGRLPFHGEDIWNAHELTWLDDRGKPRVATAEIRVPAESPNIIESKSMKLYLNSLSMTAYANPELVASTISADLSRTAGAPVIVALHPVTGSRAVERLPGDCIDDMDAGCSSNEVDPRLLGVAGGEVVSAELHSHLLRSLCPITGQPDLGSVLIRYRGRQIDRAALLRYIVSYRNHGAFHECCVERMFLDIKNACGPETLTVYARYNRRGGIDINPFRSDCEASADNPRLWRQ